jgi:NADH dehydrogenase (ubiquinone) Fe-S protein 3
MMIRKACAAALPRFLRPTARPMAAPQLACHNFSTKPSYTATQETPTILNNGPAKLTTQNPKQEEFVRYLASILYPMASEISWDDQTSDILIHIYPQFARPVAKILRDHQQFQYNQLTDVTAVDTLTNARRFDVVWIFLSVLYQHRIIVRTSVDDASGVDSMTPLFKSAMWAEREVWDMFGIFFMGHPDLRRMLNDYGFDGHPLRKDFPVSGYVEVVWDFATQQIRYQSPPLLREEYRDFENIETEWEDVYHRCNNAWSYDRMVDTVNFKSVDSDLTYDDPKLQKPQAKLSAHLIKNW